MTVGADEVRTAVDSGRVARSFLNHRIALESSNNPSNKVQYYWVLLMAGMLDKAVYRGDKIDTFQLFSPPAFIDCTEGISDVQRWTAVLSMKVNHSDRCTRLYKLISIGIVAFAVLEREFHCGKLHSRLNGSTMHVNIWANKNGKSLFTILKSTLIFSARLTYTHSATSAPGFYKYKKSFSCLQMHQLLKQREEILFMAWTNK